MLMVWKSKFFARETAGSSARHKCRSPYVATCSFHGRPPMQCNFKSRWVMMKLLKRNVKCQHDIILATFPPALLVSDQSRPASESP